MGFYGSDQHGRDVGLSKEKKEKNVGGGEGGHKRNRQSVMTQQ